MDNHSWKLKYAPVPILLYSFPALGTSSWKHFTQFTTFLSKFCPCTVRTVIIHRALHAPPSTACLAKLRAALPTWAHTEQPRVKSHLNLDLLSCNLFWLLPQHKSAITLCMDRTRDMIHFRFELWFAFKRTGLPPNHGLLQVTTQARAILISFFNATLEGIFKNSQVSQDYQLQKLLLSPQDPLVLPLHTCLCGYTEHQIREIIWLKNNPDLFGQQLPKHSTPAVNVRCYTNISDKFLATEIPKR